MNLNSQVYIEWAEKMNAHIAAKPQGLDAVRADCAAMRTAINEFLEWERGSDADYRGQEVRWMDHTEALALAEKEAGK